MNKTTTNTMNYAARLLLKRLPVLVMLAGSLLTGCSDNDDIITPDESETDVPWVILDTDIGSSTDDLIAMKLLYDAHHSGKIQLKAVMVNRDGLQNLRVTDIMNTYYGMSEVKIGQVTNGVPDPHIFNDYWKMALPED